MTNAALRIAAAIRRPMSCHSASESGLDTSRPSGVRTTVLRLVSSALTAEEAFFAGLGIRDARRQRAHRTRRRQPDLLRELDAAFAHGSAREAVAPGDLGHRVAEERHARGERQALERELRVFLNEQLTEQPADDIPHLLRIRVLGLVARLVTRWFDAFEEVRFFGGQWRFGKIAFRKIGAVAVLIAHRFGESGGFDTGIFGGCERGEPCRVLPAIV